MPKTRYSLMKFQEVEWRTLVDDFRTACTQILTLLLLLSKKGIYPLANSLILQGLRRIAYIYKDFSCRLPIRPTRSPSMEINESILKEAKFTKGQLKSLSKAFWALVEKYNFNNTDLRAVLGKDFDPKTLKKYKDTKSFPEGETDVILRAAHVLSIHWSLRVLYPHNPSLVYSWMKTKTPEFDNKSPIEILKDSGYKSFIALMSLRNYLDYKRAAA
jgi:hypothetical protein